MSIETVTHFSLQYKMPDQAEKQYLLSASKTAA